MATVIVEQKSVDRLVEEWIELTKADREVSVEKLCEDNPDLISVVQQKTLQQLLLEWEQLNDGVGDLERNEKRPKCPDDLLDEFDRHVDAQIQMRLRSTSTTNATIPKSDDEFDFVAVTRYRTKKLLGRGGYGEVYLAHDLELGREVAIKVIREDKASSPKDSSYFVVEAVDTANMNHPGVINIFSIGQTEDNRPFYTMPIMEENLAKRIKEYHDPSANRTKQESRRLRIQLLTQFAAVCRTMHNAHLKGIVHCDLKPDNIMIGENNETRITDWGLLIRFQNDPNAKSSLNQLRSSICGKIPPPEDRYWGTITYMSPEQSLKRPDMITPQSDVYCLGSILYEILTGQMPIKASSTLTQMLDDLMNHEITDPRNVNPDISPALEAICLKAIERKQKDRYETAQDLADDIQNWLMLEPVSVYRDPFSEQFVRWIRHGSRMTQRFVFIAFVVGMLSAILLACFLFH